MSVILPRKITAHVSKLTVYMYFAKDTMETADFLCVIQLNLKPKDVNTVSNINCIVILLFSFFSSSCLQQTVTSFSCS